MQVDIYEKLPVPFGLVRFGVAPDHPEVKVMRKADYERTVIISVLVECHQLVHEHGQQRPRRFLRQHSDWQRH